MTKKTLRIGAVSYLNTKPLVYRLEHYAPQAEIRYDLPSRLADGLAIGHFDVALIPSIEYLRNPAYTILSDACIGCRGPVLSVKLLSRVPMHRIRSLALDEGSRTSAVLARILLRERYQITPQLESLAIGQDVLQSQTDAVLVIGDRAMQTSVEPFIEQWDLGDQWCRWSELPFVFAMWVGRPGFEPDGLDEALSMARDDGVAHLRKIAQRESAHVPLSAAECLSYLRDNLYFYLGPRERRGLELYFSLAQRLDLVAT